MIARRRPREASPRASLSPNQQPGVLRALRRLDAWVDGPRAQAPDALPWTRSPANTRRAYSGRSAGSTLGSDGRGLGGRDDATLAAYLAFREQGVLLTGDKLLHRPGTAARLLAALEEAADDPEESYSERVTEKMRSMLGCIQEFLLDIGNFTSPRIARVKW